jgi:hypothetical protein
MPPESTIAFRSHTPFFKYLVKIYSSTKTATAQSVSDAVLGIHKLIGTTPLFKLDCSAAKQFGQSPGKQQMLSATAAVSATAVLSSKEKALVSHHLAQLPVCPLSLTLSVCAVNQAQNPARNTLLVNRSLMPPPGNSGTMLSAARPEPTSPLQGR